MRFLRDNILPGKDGFLQDDREPTFRERERGRERARASESEREMRIYQDI